MGYANPRTVSALIRNKEDRENLGVGTVHSSTTLTETEGLKDKPRKKILKAVEKKKIETSALVGGAPSFFLSSLACAAPAIGAAATFLYLPVK